MKKVLSKFGEEQGEMRTPRRSEKGATAIEFALAMPILFVILFAIFEFGLAFWYQQELTSAVREGARKGVIMVNPRRTESYIKGIVTTYMDGVGLTNSARNVTCTNKCPCTASGDTLTVTVTYPTKFTVVSNLTKLFFGSSSISSSRNLTATISMQCE
jgi:Flp pilus assembly protein TadG